MTLTLKARVRGGRLLLDEPVDLPEGTEVELVPADEGEGLDDADRPVFTRRCGVQRTSSAPARGRVRRRCSPSLALTGLDSPVASVEAVSRRRLAGSAPTRSFSLTFPRPPARRGPAS